ncbi:hypothetical protein CAEBREN_24422 [Caenorhabditis brenneri]|uniref:Uncharacterized protein n=1 Tax=Caenorhabditis brenneri TaxID=135651 RepID=G0MKF4_CAEBE|nr:hypothetical protein CAEBREN_24422 [Caenorhabditis brenneri]
MLLLETSPKLTRY